MTPVGSAPRPRLQPSSRELLDRLEKDIAWLKQRGLWSAGLHARSLARYQAAGGALEGLDEFRRRHAPVTAFPKTPGSNESTA